MLKYPPLKQNNIPDTLIYVRPQKNIFGTTDIHANMFDLKTGKLCTKMVCSREIIDIGNTKKPSLYIGHLISLEKGKGYGTKMMTFAHTISKKLGCNGNLHLYAFNLIAKKRVPHIFYRKLGMNTGDIKTDNMLDKYIKKNKAGSHKKFPSIMMYYPAIEYTNDIPVPKNSIKEIFRKILKFIKR